MSAPSENQQIAIIRMIHPIQMTRNVDAARKPYHGSFGAVAFAGRYHEGEDRHMALLDAGDRMIEPMAPRIPEPAGTTTSKM